MNVMGSDPSQLDWACEPVDRSHMPKFRAYVLVFSAALLPGIGQHGIIGSGTDGFNDEQHVVLTSGEVTGVD